MECIVKCVAVNIASSFERGIYKERRIGRIFKSAKDARKEYDLMRCNYELCNDDGETVREVFNCDRFIMRKNFW